VSPALALQLFEECMTGGSTPEAGTRRHAYNPKSLLIVSYPWMSPELPDPNGHHSRSLMRYLRALFDSRLAFLPSSDAGVFIDFMSLPQHGPKEPRTEAETCVFQQGLRCMHALYSHSRTVVLQLKAAPGRDYDASGWCVFEQTVASIFKEHSRLLDLSLVTGPAALASGVLGDDQAGGLSGRSTQAEGRRGMPGIVGEPVIRSVIRSQAGESMDTLHRPSPGVVDLHSFSADGSYGARHQRSDAATVARLATFSLGVDTGLAGDRLALGDASDRLGGVVGADRLSLAELERQGRAQRQPPLHPVRFASRLLELHFTNGADRDVVATMYSQFYLFATEHTTLLNLNTPVGGELSSADWGHTQQVAVLAEGLSGFVACHTLKLDGHCFDDEQVELILPALGDMAALKTLSNESVRCRWTSSGRARLLTFCEDRGIELKLRPERPVAGSAPGSASAAVAV